MIKKLLFIKEYRKRIIEISSFIICCTFSIFNLTLFFMSKSIWYFMLAVYYVSLSFARGIIYFENRMRSKNKIKELSIYRKSAIFLLIMNFALGISTILTVSFQGSFKYSGIFIYGVAIYAFFKILFAIINISKAHGSQNYLELAYRSVNLVDGAFSLFAFQTALLNKFLQNGEFPLANLLTGSLVVIFALSLSIFMLIKAKREINSMYWFVSNFSL